VGPGGAARLPAAHAAGRLDAIGLRPSVEPILEIGQHVDSVNGNSHHHEAPAPQPSLFSWAEFMAKAPVKSKCRRRNAQSPALPLFEWVLEQEREPVGAGRWIAHTGEDTSSRCPPPHARVCGLFALHPGP